MTVNCSPSNLLSAAIAACPPHRCVDQSGRPTVIPAFLFDFYGSPHGIIRAVANSLEILSEWVTPLDEESVAQNELFRYIASECRDLVARVDEKAREFDQQYGN
jgi:hypothetical protein